MSVATKWLELAKIERQRARERDGTSEKLKQNTPGYFKQGGREMIDTTKEIIHMARQGKDAEQIILSPLSTGFDGDGPQSAAESAAARGGGARG